MNTISKSLSLFHGNLSILLHVLDIIINKIHVKVVIAQNDTDLSFIKLYINVLKCCAFVKHFKTLILRLIQANQCHSELSQLLHKFYLLFCTGYIRGHLNFHGIAIKLFDIVFMFVMSLSILWIRSVSAAWGNPTGHGIQFQGMGILFNYLCH